MRSVECRLRNGGGTFDPRGVFTSSTPARYIPHSALRIPHSGVVMGFPHKPHPKETVLLSKHFGEVDARTYKGWVKRGGDRKSTRLNSSHGSISYAVFCLK